VKRKIKSNNDEKKELVLMCVCVLTDFFVQPNTGKYTLARFSKMNEIEKMIK
jgi:hypothetical protein